MACGTSSVAACEPGEDRACWDHANPPTPLPFQHGATSAARGAAGGAAGGAASGAARGAAGGAARGIATG